MTVKSRARRMVLKAVESGELARPDVCERCGSKPKYGPGRALPVEAHHVDYEQPLDVRWLCRTCHISTHAAEQRAHRERRLMRALPEYRRWRRAVSYPTCGDSGGWSATKRRPCKKRVDRKGDRCFHHQRPLECVVPVKRGAPGDPSGLLWTTDETIREGSETRRKDDRVTP